VVKELTARGVLSPSRIYEGMNVEQKRKYKKKGIEETFPRVENIYTEESSVPRQAIELLTDGRQRESEDFDMTKRGQSVMDESEKIGKLEKELDRIRSLRNSDNCSLADTETIKNLQKKLIDVVQERDSISNENKILKEKTQPEMFKEIQERFYDKPGLLKGEQLQKANETAGKHIIKLLERYNSILNDAALAGQPIPVGLYVIAKPEMVFIPVRFTVNFEKKRVDISLWEKKLT
jgi:hypothetical protein